MKEKWLEKLEGKIDALVTEILQLRGEVSALQAENAVLQAEKVRHTDQLQGLLASLDTMAFEERMVANTISVNALHGLESHAVEI